MEYEIYHHGVKGMHWGIRRYQKKDGSLTRLGKKRRQADDDEQKKQQKEQAKAQKKASSQQAKAEKKQAKAAEEKRKEDEATEQMRAKLLKSSDPQEIYENRHLLTTAEINERLTRIDAEKRLNVEVEKSKTAANNKKQQEEQARDDAIKKKQQDQEAEKKAREEAKNQKKQAHEEAAQKKQQEREAEKKAREEAKTQKKQSHDEAVKKKQQEQEAEVLSRIKDKILKSNDPQFIYENRHLLTTAEINERLTRIDAEKRLGSEAAKSKVTFGDKVQRTVDKASKAANTIETAYQITQKPFYKALMKKLKGEQTPKTPKFDMDELLKKVDTMSTKELTDTLNRTKNINSIEALMQQIKNRRNTTP